MMKRLMFFLGLGVALTSMSGSKPVAYEGPVHWLTFEQAVEKSKTEKRPILIDIFTTWCGPCRQMDKYTFGDSLVAALLNTKFYPVKLNAEQREDVVYKGTTFKFLPERNYHQLAAALVQNQLVYPTIVFMNENFEIIQPMPGARPAPEFHMIAQFIGEGHYKTVKWEDWQKVYKSPY